MVWFPYDLFSCKKRHQYVFTMILFIKSVLFWGKCKRFVLNSKEKLTFFYLFAASCIFPFTSSTFSPTFPATSLLTSSALCFA